MADFEIRGADDIDALVKALRNHADSKALRKELYQGLNSVTKELRGELKEAIPAALPKRGGLAAEVQGSTRFSATAKSGRFAGVTVWAKNSRHDIRTLTGQRLRHPVWGNRRRWVTQTKGVDPAVFMGKFDDQKPSVQRRILEVLNEIARKVTR